MECGGGDRCVEWGWCFGVGDRGCEGGGVVWNESLPVGGVAWCYGG